MSIKKVFKYLSNFQRKKVTTLFYFISIFSSEKIFSQNVDVLWESSFPKEISVSQYHFESVLQNHSIERILVYPNASIKNFNSETQQISGIFYLKEGNNTFNFIFIDDKGKKNKKEISILYKVPITLPQKTKTKIATSKTYKPTIKSNINNKKKLEEENASLKKEIENLKAKNKNIEKNFYAASSELNEQKDTNIPQVKTVTRLISAEKLKLPSAPGIYLMPFIGTSQTYRDAAREYLHSEEFSTLLASLNGVEERTQNQLLIPSSSFFNLLKKTGEEKKYYKILENISKSFLRNSSSDFLEKETFSYLLENNFLEKIYRHQEKNIFAISKQSAIVFTNQSIELKDFKQKNNLTEIVVVATNSKGIFLKKF